MIGGRQSKLISSAAALMTFSGSSEEMYLMLKDSTALHEATTDDVIRIRYTGRLDGFAVIQGPRLRHAGHTITGRVQEAGSRVERYPAAANLTGYPGKIGAMTTD